MSQYIPTEQVVLAPWDRMLRQVARRGWASIPAALHPSLVARLAATEAVGGAATEPVQTVALSQAPSLVRDLSVHLAASLSVAAELQQLPVLPLFNQITWIRHRYPGGPFPQPAGSGVRVGVTAIVCLCGPIAIRVGDVPLRSALIDQGSGGLALLRAQDWPCRGCRPAVAAIEAVAPVPVMIMTLSALSATGPQRYSRHGV